LIGAPDWAKAAPATSAPANTLAKMIDFTRLLPLFASLRFVGHGGLVFGRVIQIMSRSNQIGS
jgi:hypothetical protein